MDIKMRSLNSLVEEFFSPQCGNDRKRQIEVMLMQLKTAASPQEIVGYFLGSFQSQPATPMLHMFTIQMVEDLVNSRWHLVSADLQKLIKTALREGLVKFHKSTENDFVSVKICKVIADIGRLELNLTEYFGFVKELIVSGKGMPSGLRLLKVTLEEWASTNSHCFLYSSSDAKRAMKLFMETEFQSVYAILIDFLYTITGNYKTHFTQLNSERLPNSFITSRRLIQLNVLELCVCPSAEQFVCPSIPDETALMAVLTFECLEKILPWSPVVDIFLTNSEASKDVDNLWTVIHFYMTLASQKFGTERCCNLVMAAIQCLLEILPVPYRVTEKLVEFSVEMFAVSCMLLQNISKRLEGMSSISDTTSGFFDKMIEFQRLQMFHYFHRFFNTCQFLSDFSDAERYLSCLVTFTYSQISITHYVSLLDVWQLFLDFLIVRKENKGLKTDVETSNPNAVPLTQLLNSILEGLLLLVKRKLMVSENPRLLNEWLDVDDILDWKSDAESDWSVCSMTSADLVTKIAQFYPMETFQLFSTFDEKRQHYLQVCQSQMEPIHLAPGDAQRVLSVWLDMTTLLKILGDVSGVFLEDESFQERRELCQSFVDRISDAVQLSQRAKLYNRTFTTDDATLKKSSAAVLSSLLECLASYSYWVAQSYAEAQRTGDQNIRISSVISSTIDSCISLLSDNPCEQLLNAAVSCLRAFLMVVRPHYALSMHSVQELYSRACMTEILPYPHEVANSLYCCLATYLVVPWHNAVDCEQEWSDRKQLFTRLMNGRLEPFNRAYNLRVNLPAVDMQISNSLMTLVPLINAISDVVAEEGTKTKQIYHSVIKDTIRRFLHLVEAFVSANLGEVIERLFSAIHSIMKALIAQLESDLKPEVVASTLMDLMMKIDNNPSVPLHLNPSFCKILTISLRILHLIVIQSGKKFSHFIGYVVTTSCNLVKSRIIQETDDVELKEAFLTLIEAVFCCHWKMFFPVANGGSAKEPVSQFDDHCTTLITAFCTGLSDSQTNIAKLSLSSLSKLNATWGLFKKNEFIVKSLPLVMDRLLQVLVNDSHPILVEEICENLQAMVCATHTSVRMFQTCVIRTFEADQTVVERLCQGLDALTSTNATVNSNPANTDQSLLDFVSSISVETDLSSFNRVIQELVRSQKLKSL